MSYSTNGYLTNITGAVSGATTDYTYDGYGRVVSSTNVLGRFKNHYMNAAHRLSAVVIPRESQRDTILQPRVAPPAVPMNLSASAELHEALKPSGQKSGTRVTRPSEVHGG